MSSTYVSFRGPVGGKQQRIITITPKKDYPFKIKDVKARYSSKLKVDWKEVKTDKGIKYEILARNIQEIPGSCKNRITVNIDSKYKDQLVIHVGGYLSAPKKNKVKKK